MRMTLHEMLGYLGCIARTQLRDADCEGLRRLVAEEVPWEELWALAEKEGVAGLLFHHLEDRNLLDFLPKPFLKRIEDEYLETAKLSLAVYAQAMSLSALLQKAQLSVIALQGLSVAGLYGDPGLRPMCDADLMVRPQDQSRFKKLLLEVGYRLSHPLFPDQFSKDGVWLDVHTHILNLDRIRSRRFLFPEDLTPMWEKARPFAGHQGGLLVLDPCDNIVALTAHALKHGYSRLIWLADVHEALLKMGASANGWKEIADRARYWRQERVVAYAFSLVEQLFGLPIPGWILAELGIERLGRLEQSLLHSVIQGFSSPDIPVALQLCSVSGAGNKWRFLRETVFPREEVMAQIFRKAPGNIRGMEYARRTAEALLLLGRSVRRLRPHFRKRGT